jgi:thiamine-monophosphate kinase
VGDLLCTTGALGGAGGSLWACSRAGLTARSSRGWSPSRASEGRALAQIRAVTAMMDNCDGLALSLSDLALVSRVGFVVQEDALPLDAGLVEMVGQEKEQEFVMSAGGDFDFVFTVRSGGWRRPGGPAP